MQRHQSMQSYVDSFTGEKLENLRAAVVRIREATYAGIKITLADLILRFGGFTKLDHTTRDQMYEDMKGILDMVLIKILYILYPYPPDMQSLIHPMLKKSYIDGLGDQTETQRALLVGFFEGLDPTDSEWRRERLLLRVQKLYSEEIEKFLKDLLNPVQGAVAVLESDNAEVESFIHSLIREFYRMLTFSKYIGKGDSLADSYGFTGIRALFEWTINEIFDEHMGRSSGGRGGKTHTRNDFIH